MPATCRRSQAACCCQCRSAPIPSLKTNQVPISEPASTQEELAQSQSWLRLTALVLFLPFNVVTYCQYTVNSSASLSEGNTPQAC